MKQSVIYIIGIWLMLWTCIACTDNELVQVTPQGTIGNNEVCTTLRFFFDTPDSVKVSTRATLGVVPESRVQNIFVYLFVGDNCVYSHYFDNTNKLGSETDVTNAQWNCWYVDNMVEDEDPALDKDATNGAIRMRTADITGGTLYLIANIDADMVNISPEKLNTIRTKQEIEQLTAKLNQEITSRNGYFPMTAVIRDVNIADNTVKLSDNTTPAVAYLKRLDAKVTVNVRTAINYAQESESESDGNNIVTKTQTLKGFTPKSWQVINLPKGCYAFAEDSNGNPSIDYEEAGYFNSSETAFDQSIEEEFKYTVGTNEVSVNQTTHKFSFYMLENQESQNKGGTVSKYHERDKRTKEADGSYPENTEGNMWENAPEAATYLIIKGEVEMDVDVSNEAKQQHLAADVTYYIHLGDFGGGNFDNYDILRNTSYTYNITIKGVKNIEVEVETSQQKEAEKVTENESGATGMVYVAKEDIMTFDAHYGQRVYMIDAASINPDEVTWYVSTPFSEGLPEKIGDVEIPAGRDYKWVQFMINELNEDGTYSKNNQTYPGDRDNPENKNPNRFKLMDVVEFTTYIKDEVRKLKDNDETTVSAFKKEYDEDWFKWYEENNSTGADKNDQTKVYWRDRLYVTIFVNEYYYEEDPITGNKRDDLWKEFVNQPNRLMHILCDNQKSLDGASSSTGSIVTIRQRSIQTPYNIETSDNAWGCETEDETANSYLWFYSETETVDDGNNFYTYQNEGNDDDLNGLYNTAKLWGYTKDDELKWIDYVDYNRTNDYQGVNDIFPRYWMQNGKMVLKYTPMMRNRDLDGDGFIDANEIRWYIASIEQLFGLYIGDQGLSADAQLYSPSRRTYTKNDTYPTDHPLGKKVVINNGEEIRAYMHTEHVVSSSKSKKKNVQVNYYYYYDVHTPTVIWAEEGVATSYYRQEFGWNPDNFAVQTIRCVRNLGIDAPTADNILTNTENTPDPLITMIPPTGSIDQNSVFTFDLSRVNTKSLRYYTTHELEPTDEFNEMARPYKKFETGALFETGTYDNLYNTIIGGNSPITDSDYRIPNVREAALMMLYCDEYSDWWNGDTRYIQPISYYSRGSKTTDANMKFKNNPTWVFGINRFSSLGEKATQTRAVRDIK